MTFIRDPKRDTFRLLKQKIARVEADLPNQPYRTRLFEEPLDREIRDSGYMVRRGSWDIADVPDLDNPPEFKI